MKSTFNYTICQPIKEFVTHLRNKIIERELIHSCVRGVDPDGNTNCNVKTPVGDGQSFPARRHQQANLRQSGIRLSPDYPIHLHSSTKRQGSKSETGSNKHSPIDRLLFLFQVLLPQLSCWEMLPAVLFVSFMGRVV